MAKNKKYLIPACNTGGGRGGLITRRVLSLSAVLLVLVLNYSPVLADDPTPTPTSAPTTTPTIAMGYCPIGTPLPTALSLEYYENCSECIPKTSTPTAELGGTQFVLSTFELNALTLTPQGSPTATQTLTPVPVTPTITPTTVNYVRWWRDGAHLPDGTYTWGSAVSTTQINYGYPWSASIKFDLSGTFTAGYWDHYYGNTMVCIRISNQTGGVVTVTDDAGGHAVSAGGSYYVQLWSSITPMSQYQTLSYNVSKNIGIQGNVAHASNVTINKYMYSGSCGSSYAGSGSDSKTSDLFTVRSGILNSTPTVTPTPSATPNVLAECSEYDYQGIDDQLAGYSGISMYQGSCTVILPDFGVHLPAVGENIPAIDFDSPGVSICPKWVNLGTFQVAGFEIPGDLIAIPALMFALYLVFAL